MKTQLIILLFIYLAMHDNFANAQNNITTDTLRNLLINNIYSEYKTPAKRKILSLKNKPLIKKLNPLTYISAGLLFFYQRILSEQIQAHCMYQISCSNYTKYEIEKNGFRGFLLGINQLDNCFKGVIYDYPSYQVTNEDKVINSIEKIDKKN